MMAARVLQHAFSPCGINLFPIRRDFAIDAVGKNKENTMLKTFAAALLATTLIAGPAFAAPPSGSAGSTPAASTAAPASTHAVTKQTAKTVKHARKHVRKHVVRHKVGKMKVSRHAKSAKMHRHHAAAPVKHVKGRKGGKGA
jgi:hypothetical protein